MTTAEVVEQLTEQIRAVEKRTQEEFNKTGRQFLGRKPSWPRTPSTAH